jgi:superfamily I DNA/RNA helicase
MLTESSQITRKSDWPDGKENIALSTLHSAKGLEFDHVFILGLNAEVTVHGEEDDDDTLVTLRKLLAMGIGRARYSVMIGYKPEEASRLIGYLDPSSYEGVDL